MKKRNMILICVIILFSICGCKNNCDCDCENKKYDDNLNDYTTNSNIMQKEMVENPFIVSDEKGYARDNYSYYIDGIITNTLNINFTYAEIRYALYDNSGAVITTCYDNITFIEANGIWKYSVHCPMPKGDASNVGTFKMIEYKYNY